MSRKDSKVSKSEASVNIKNEARKEIKWSPRCLKKHIKVSQKHDSHSVLLSIQLQSDGFLTLRKMFEIRRNNMLLIYLTNKVR